MCGAFLSQPQTNKHTRVHQHRKIRVVTSEMQGWRKDMEDAVLFHRISKEIYLFGIFDGHSGGEVARYCGKYFPKVLENNSDFIQGNYAVALQQSFQKLDLMLISQEAQQELKQYVIQKRGKALSNDKLADSMGCTANVILMVENKIFVANAGDSRSALSRNGEMIALSKDHKPDDPSELERIEAAGYKVEKGRINFHLNLSRSIGDHQYKRNKDLPFDKQSIISKPDITETQLCKDDDFIIMGCDGIWERYENTGQQLIDIIRQERIKGVKPEAVIQNMLDKLLSQGPQKQELGCDNMSVILIQFNKLAM